jgi:hypothetical protein
MRREKRVRRKNKICIQRKLLLQAYGIFERPDFLALTVDIKIWSILRVWNILWGKRNKEKHGTSRA